MSRGEKRLRAGAEYVTRRNDIVKRRGLHNTPEAVPSFGHKEILREGRLWIGLIFAAVTMTLC